MIQPLNPFTIVQERLLKTVCRNESVRRLFKRGNLLSVEKRTRRQNVTVADLPDLTIRTIGGEGQAHWTSTSSRFVRNYVAEIAAKSMIEQADLFDLQWAIASAIASADDNLNLPFVLQIELGFHDDSSETIDRGNVHWLTVINFQVEMAFKREDLLKTKQTWLDELEPDVN